MKPAKFPENSPLMQAGLCGCSRQQGGAEARCHQARTSLVPRKPLLGATASGCCHPSALHLLFDAFSCSASLWSHLITSKWLILFWFGGWPCASATIAFWLEITLNSLLLGTEPQVTCVSSWGWELWNGCWPMGPGSSGSGPSCSEPCKLLAYKRKNKGERAGVVLLVLEVSSLVEQPCLV